jgi:hypothetical protein
MRSEGTVWCAKCSVRIAPYEAQTVYRRNKYHQDCFLNVVREEADQEKAVRSGARPADAEQRRSA